MGISQIISNITGVRRTNENQALQNNGSDFSQPQQINPSVMPYGQDPNIMYQQQLINQNQGLPIQNNQQMMQSQMINQGQYANPQQFNMNPQPVVMQQSTLDYQKRVLEEKNGGYNLAQQQQIIVPRRMAPVQPKRKAVPVEFDNGMYQQNLDFSNPQPIEYDNYQDLNELERMNSDFHYYEQQQNQIHQPQFQPQIMNYNGNQQQMMSQPQYRNNGMSQSSIDYNNFYENNYRPSQQYDAPVYHDYETPYHTATQRQNTINILPTQIAREVRSEKMRVAIMMIIGVVGIVLTSILLAGYYKMVDLSAAKRDDASFAGFSFQQTPYPFISIVFLIISTLVFFLGFTDYSLLYANVKKYERDLISGKESVPYFITRNYRNILARGVYMTWLCFATYIIGAISLGILYGLQGLYDSGSRQIYILFWKVGSLKSFKTDITINIIVLFGTLVTHITNIVWSRARKNNVIAYYGAPIISSDEERTIKKRANKICIIITCIVLAIILFAIVIPWIILRRRRGKSMMPFGNARSN